MIRLDKYLADMGIGTRSEVKNFIKKGRIVVNGDVAKAADLKIDENTAEVMCDGKQVGYARFRYYLLNKPAGCVSATEDKLSETVLKFLKNEPIKDCFPVGRLDKDTEGLLLITNDGALAHNLLAPGKHVEKEYIAFTDKSISKEHFDQFGQGLDIGDDKPTMPAGIEEVSKEKAEALYELKSDLAADFTYEAVYKVTLNEGRYHQVKRMFEVCGANVVYLKRVRMGNLTLPESLSPGDYISLSVEDIIK